jgi:hypothetical protein
MLFLAMLKVGVPRFPTLVDANVFTNEFVALLWA